MLLNVLDGLADDDAAGLRQSAVREEKRPVTDDGRHAAEEEDGLSGG